MQFHLKKAFHGMQYFVIKQSRYFFVCEMLLPEHKGRKAIILYVGIFMGVTISLQLQLQVAIKTNGLA
jgi:hypothetical protein